jgi:A/G-specific adenine glycosylase
MLTEVSRRLLDWYAGAARRLPWRGVQDPYAVWVSEIMLQQTRVETVIPYYERWLQRFPNVAALAEADEQDVLRLWEGLGYYSRARSLHRAARRVVQEFGGVLPAERDLLESLPGIGRYTAGAIASIAFGKDEAALDGNIRRVLSRVENMELPARSPQGERVLWELARKHLPPRQAGDYNQALMDLGATICTPTRPACLMCPLAGVCLSRELALQELRPVMEEKKAVPHLTVTAAVIRREGKVLLALRPAEGLLGSMWEFPGGKLEQGETLPECLVREIREELDAEIRVGEELGVFRHAYTHFKVTLHAFLCELVDGSQPRAVEAQDVRWVGVADLKDYPMGKIDRQISKRLAEG